MSETDHKRWSRSCIIFLQPGQFPPHRFECEKLGNANGLKGSIRDYPGSAGNLCVFVRRSFLRAVSEILRISGESRRVAASWEFFAWFFMFSCFAFAKGKWQRIIDEDDQLFVRHKNLESSRVTEGQRDRERITLRFHSSESARKKIEPLLRIF